MDEWYAADSDSEDSATAMREDGLEEEKWGCSCTKAQSPMEAEHTVQEHPPVANQDEPLYGEWMIAKRKSRPQKKDQGANVSLKGTKTGQGAPQNAGGSRFAALEEEEETQTGTEHPQPARKEKESPPPREPQATSPTVCNINEGIGKATDTQTIQRNSGEKAVQPTRTAVEPPLSKLERDGGSGQPQVTLASKTDGVQGRPPDSSPYNGLTKSMVTNENTANFSSGMQIDGTQPPVAQL
ncbi:unnamed protein product [Linum trigynum]|uniref:Uncharacterized protein n=1 Tax=Linum trigynum TaxID=586398 RepID=A0AAV2FPA3_9ROSI